MNKNYKEFKEMYDIFNDQLNKVRDGLIDGLKTLVRLNGNLNLEKFSNGGVTYLVVYVEPHKGLEITDFKYINGDLYLYGNDVKVAKIGDLDTNEIMLIYCSISEIIEEFVLD